MIAHLRAEIENGDARTDSALVAKSEAGKVMTDLRGHAESKRKALSNSGIKVCTHLFGSSSWRGLRRHRETPSRSRVDRNPVGCHPNRKQPDPRSAPSPSPSTRWPAFTTRLTTKSVSQESPAALLNLLRSGAMQPRRFNSPRSSQNPGLSDGFLASLAELAKHDGIGNALSAYGLGGGGGAFDWLTGLSSALKSQRSALKSQRSALRNYNPQRVRLPFICPDLFTRFINQIVEPMTVPAGCISSRSHHQILPTAFHHRRCTVPSTLIPILTTPLPS